MTKQFRKAVYIGRFQPPHIEHIATIQDGLEIADQVIVVIGSAHVPRSPRNPWTAKERQEMIQLCFSEDENARLSFVYLEDSLYNDSFWAANLQNLLGLGDEKVALLGYKKDASSFYLDMFPQWQFVPRMTGQKGLDATDIRKKVFLDLELPSATEVADPICTRLAQYMLNHDFFDFMTKEFSYIRKYKESWACAPYPPTFVTADAIVIKSSHVLVVKRGQHPGKNLFALPGGFVNPDELLVDCCIRELKEETKIAVSTEELYRSIQDQKVFDHPRRSLRGRTITHAFLINLGIGKLPTVKAGDDAAEALWMPLSDVNRYRELFFEDHVSVVHGLTSRL